MKNKRHKHIRKGLGLNLFTSTISTMLVLVLLGTVLFFFTIAGNLRDSLRENFTVSLMLDDDIPQADTYRLQQKLRRLPCVNHVGYISKERAAKEQAKALGTDPTEFLGSNPLPATFELHLNAYYANRDSLEPFLNDFKKERYILEINYPEELMDEVNNNIQKVSLVLLVLAVLLAFISIELINNTMRMSIYAHRFQIQTMKLVGARWSFIRRPFLQRALLVGVTAAALADGVLYGGICALKGFEPQMEELLSWDVLLITLLGVLAFGVIITTSCAFFSVNRNLRINRDKLYLR